MEMSEEANVHSSALQMRGILCSNYTVQASPKEQTSLLLLPVLWFGLLEFNSFFYSF